MQRQQRGQRDRNRDREQESNEIESVVNIRRVAKTVAGGRRFTFNALMVVGDGDGRVGMGQGRAGEVPDAIRKGSANAKRNMISVPRNGTTIPQQILSKFDGARVLLKPAAPGTGVRAGAAVRAVIEAAGIKDILTKSLGSANHTNIVRATLKGLEQMRALPERNQKEESVPQNEASTDETLGEQTSDASQEEAQ
ncbi:30S ribosomal protein S5 [Dehalococcoidia bacterium]|nr:30S ribosomal protein S5 [Dehalococcoidia bacterium]